jgi:dolichyl-phosphate beta-glucosyltransferase
MEGVEHKGGALASPRCVIAVPCYNEELRLQVDQFVAFARDHADIHLLFVNDGSTDGTAALLQQLQAANPERISVLDQRPNAGKAEAVRNGMLQGLASGAEYVGFWDADLATPLDAIEPLLNVMTARPALEMVFGSRVRLLGRRVERQPLRHYLGRCFATAASLVLHLPIYDTQCGAKIFRATPNLASVLSKKFISRWIFDVEILGRFVQLNGGNAVPLQSTIFEYPLHEWYDIAGTRLKPLDFFKAFGELWTIRSTYLRK